jgi:hypothetical protein
MRVSRKRVGRCQVPPKDGSVRSPVADSGFECQNLRILAET